MKPIQVINRQCFQSLVSKDRKRPDGFSRKKCFESIVNGKWFDRLCDLTILFDNNRGPLEGHFIEEYKDKFTIIEDSFGTEGASFLKVLDFIEKSDWPDDTIVYIVEDDYLHLNEWALFLIEAIHLTDLLKWQSGYVTLYDHFDKYTKTYNGLTSNIFVTKSRHWRTTPSTTNTYAFRKKTLMNSIEIHRKFSTGCDVSKDHEKFLELADNGNLLISPIPAVATHCEYGLVSPIIDWKV